MKLVNEMYVHHVQTMFPIDYSNHFIFTGTWTGLKIWLSRIIKKRFQSQMSLFRNTFWTCYIFTSSFPIAMLVMLNVESLNLKLSKALHWQGQKRQKWKI
jgi:hypothetical protein